MNKSIFVTFAGGLLSAILTFMVNVVAAKYLVVAEFNQLAVFINATVILSAIFEFGLSSSLIVIYKKKDKHHCEMLASMAIVGMIGIFILLLPVVYYYWGISSVLCVFASLLMTVHKVLNIFNQIDEAWGRYSFNNVLSNAVKLGFVTTAVIVYPTNVIYALMGLTVAYIVSIVYIISGRYISLSFPHKNYYFKDDLPVIFKLYLVTAIVALLMRVDVIIIDGMGFNAANYFVASTLCMLIPLLNSSVMAVLVKVGIQNVQKKQKIFFIAFIILGYLICSKWVLSLLYGNTYESAANIMYILTIAFSVGLYFTDKESVLYHQSNNRLLYLKITQLLVMIVSSYPLITYLGEIGMAYAVLLSRLVGWLYLITICENEKKI
ncbi:TPA: hypothetical protein ACOEL9_000998 [Enterobacter hormaechei subsp. xiangfangensis]